MKTLFTAPYLIIYLHEGPNPVLELSWQGYLPSTEFRDAALHSVALGAQYQVWGWISDDRLLGALRPRDLEWVAEAGMKALNGVNIQRFAHLESQDALNRRTIDGMYQQVNPALAYEVQRFDDITQARIWASNQ